MSAGPRCPRTSRGDLASRALLGIGGEHHVASRAPADDDTWQSIGSLARRIVARIEKPHADAGATGETAQLRRYTDRDCHRRQASSMSNAAWNASRLGAMVAVGALVAATASMVFNP